MYKLFKNKQDLRFVEKRQLIDEIGMYTLKYNYLHYYDNKEYFFNQYYNNIPYELVLDLQDTNYNIKDDYVTINNKGKIESITRKKLKKLIDIDLDNIINDFLYYLNNEHCIYDGKLFIKD